jgi:surface protein
MALILKYQIDNNEEKLSNKYWFFVRNSYTDMTWETFPANTIIYKDNKFLLTVNGWNNNNGMSEPALGSDWIEIGNISPLESKLDLTDVPGSNISIKLDLLPGKNALINWGDGLSNIVTISGEYKHKYYVPSVSTLDTANYTVTISGNVIGIGNNQVILEGMNQLYYVDSFGNLPLTSLSGAFHGATNLSSVPSSLPITVNNLSYMFSGALSFNQNINTWDTINVTNMRYMFNSAQLFDQDLDNWNTSNVTDMSFMFCNSDKFGNVYGDISTWNTKMVTIMNSMFLEANYFNNNINNWNVSNVTSMSAMFSGARVFDQDLDNWNTSNVTNMSYMFYEARQFGNVYGNISTWNTSKVTTMEQMFQGTFVFNKSLNNWNTSKVTNMSHMFYDTKLFNQDLNNWNTSKVTDMTAMFNSTDQFNGNISNWNTSNVTTMFGVFSGAKVFNCNINNWNTSKVTDMGAMFNGALVFNQSLNNWNVSNVINMKDMFFTSYGSMIFNQDLNNWNTSKVTNMESMFGNAESFNGNISNWNTINVATMSGMFNMYNVSNSRFNQNLSNWNVKKVTDMLRMFQNCKNFNQDLSKWDIKNVYSMTNMFYATALIPENFDKILNKWANLSVQPGISISAPYYSDDGLFGYNKLSNTKSWTINSNKIVNIPKVQIPIINTGTQLSFNNTLKLNIEQVANINTNINDIVYSINSTHISSASNFTLYLKYQLGAGIEYNEVINANIINSNSAPPYYSYNLFSLYRKPGSNLQLYSGSGTKESNMLDFDTEYKINANITVNNIQIAALQNIYYTFKRVKLLTLTSNTPNTLPITLGILLPTLNGVLEYSTGPVGKKTNNKLVTPSTFSLKVKYTNTLNTNTFTDTISSNIISSLYKPYPYFNLNGNALLTFKDTYDVSANISNGSIHWIGATSWQVSCLLKGTKIRTPHGYKKIETLKVGDIVLSHNEKMVKIIKVHKWDIDWNDKSSASKVYVLENNKKKSYLSAYHKFMNKEYINSTNKIKIIKNNMVEACHGNLKLARKDEICDKNDMYQLYNIQVENHEINHLVINDGMIVESWDGKLFPN